jgi:hypothetical protein
MPEGLTRDTNDLPVAVIGAGPVRMAAASHLSLRGLTPLVLEAGPNVGHAVEQWHALGELPGGSRITYGMPDVMGHDRRQYERKVTLVVRNGARTSTNSLLRRTCARCPNTRTLLERIALVRAKLCVVDRPAQRPDNPRAGSRLANSRSPRTEFIAECPDPSHALIQRRGDDESGLAPSTQQL